MSGFNLSFRIQGQVYHHIGSIVPPEGESPKFAQIYFIDGHESEVATRTAIVDGLSQTSSGVSINYCMTTITMLKCLKWPRRYLNKKVNLLMLKLLLMRPKGP